MWTRKRVFGMDTQHCERRAQFMGGVGGEASFALE